MATRIAEMVAACRRVRTTWLTRVTSRTCVLRIALTFAYTHAYNRPRHAPRAYHPPTFQSPPLPPPLSPSSSPSSFSSSSSTPTNFNRYGSRFRSLDYPFSFFSWPRKNVTVDIWKKLERIIDRVLNIGNFEINWIGWRGPLYVSLWRYKVGKSDFGEVKREERSRRLEER